MLNTKILKNITVLDLLELSARLWMGYILISNSYIGTLVPIEDLGLDNKSYRIIKAMWDTGFMMHLVKITELLVGIALVFNLYLPFAIILIFPVLVNIYGMHIFLFNSYFTKGLAMLAISSYFLFRFRHLYRPLLTKKG